ncbi:sensor histidine kinase [Tenacibaculum haliotis]|uniref:sensor histidine kinase n=1 Tax=Tenacibaculum haliotis TaxID=1888914 RepID=UPI0021AE7143|nr:histidine kinase [Tenacibaculum haliotis]MCT4699434.1 histidine kinase [Tenacibaculum haliotis]
MKQRKLHITLVALIVWSLSFSQQYTNYSIKNGLPSNHVYRITQDNRGFIWLITDKGISKFDGKNFKNFAIEDGLPSNDIWHIRITPDNKIWFFSKSSKLGYISNDKVYSFGSFRKKVLYPRTILQSKNIINFNDGSFYYSLKDSIWRASSNYLLEDSNLTKQKVIHPLINFHALIKDSIYFFNKNSKKSFFIKKGIFQTISEHGQANDSLYISTAKQYYIIENFNSKKVHLISYASQNLPKNLKYFRYHNVNNHIQLTGMDFVSYLGENGTLKNIIHIPKKLNTHFSFIDNTGNIWSATFNKGIFLLPKEKKSTKILAKNKKIQQLKLINNNIYAGIYKEGFFKINNSLEPIIKNNNFQHSISFFKDINTFIFSSEDFLYAYKNKKTSIIKTSKKNSFKNDFAKKIINHKDFLYVNNAFGIFKINPINFSIIKKYPLYGVNSFSSTNTNLFFANQSGLFILKNDSILKLQSNKLFNQPVLTQANYTQKKVIIGTEGNGAYITNGKTVSFIKKTNNLSIQDIFVDLNNNIWLATAKGVHKANKQNNNYVITQSFYESDGLISNNINSVVVKNDSLYTGTDIGLSIIYLQKEPVNQLQKIYVKSIIINETSYTGDTIIASYKKNGVFSTSFGTINFSNQQNLSYQYKLEPLQSNWITTTTPYINFTDLKPNTYFLQLKVSNHHKEEKRKTIYITITPLWYQTLWFKIGFFLLVIGFFYLFNKWATKKVKANTRKNILKKQKDIEYELYALRSQMNPHFVFNSLNAIQYYMTKNEVELSEKYLVKFSRLIRMFFDFSRQKNITLEQELLLLKSYLEIEKMRFGDDFKFSFNVDKTLNLETKIPTMLLQPIVENAVNHGLFHKKGKGLINISLKNSTFKNEFIIAIRDDGVGFLKSKEIQKKSIKKHTSKSTLIIADKIKLINQSLQWHISQEVIDLSREKSSGTLVLLTFKKIKHDKSYIS